ncbi:TPA: hypothetical protein ACF2P4_000704, partial [Legionella pneumophila]
IHDEINTLKKGLLKLILAMLRYWEYVLVSSVIRKLVPPLFLFIAEEGIYCANNTLLFECFKWRM